MVTIKDIAQIAGTSPSTVSYVLSNKPCRISQKTRERILKAAKELDYQPNALVHALRSKMSYTIAAIVPGLKSSFFPEIIFGVDEVVSEAGFQTLICQHLGSPEKLYREIAVLRSRRVDGLIIATAALPDQQAYLSDLQQKGVKLALIAESQADIPYSTFDELMGMRLVIEHLHGLGHRRIGYVGPQGLRLESLFQSLRERDLPVEESHLLLLERSRPDMDQVHAFLQRKSRVTALIGHQDSLLFPFYEYSRQTGFRIPEDLSIIGFGNSPESSILFPRLTTLDQSPCDVGREAGRIILDLILKRIPQQTHQRTLESRLIIRESTAEPFAS